MIKVVTEMSDAVPDDSQAEVIAADDSQAPEARLSVSHVELYSYICQWIATVRRPGLSQPVMLKLTDRGVLHSLLHSLIYL